MDAHGIYFGVVSNYPAMKTITLSFIFILTLLSISCVNRENDRSLEELAVDFQHAYREFKFNSIEPFISSDSKDFAKKIYKSRPKNKDKIKELIKAFEGKEVRIVSKKITEKEAEIIMCCNAFGDTFPTLWVLEDEGWKVDYEKTMNQSKKKYNHK